jgi:hypothetical protein
MNNLVVWFKEIGISGFIDIAVITLVVYTTLVWMKHRKRAAAVLTGILIVAGIYLLARQFNFHLTAAVLQGFFAIIIFVLVVIFQEELRYLFEQVARWSLNRRLGRPRPKRDARPGDEGDPAGQGSSACAQGGLSGGHQRSHYRNRDGRDCLALARQSLPGTGYRTRHVRQSSLRRACRGIYPDLDEIPRLGPGPVLQHYPDDCH